MSLVYITHHNENVLDYEKVGVERERPKVLKYISKHKKAVKRQIHQPYVTVAADGKKLLDDSGKHERRTMGCAQTPLNPPSQYLRKNEGVKWRRLHDHICPKVMPLPPVPRRSQIDYKAPCDNRKPPAVGKPPAEQPAVEKALVVQDLGCGPIEIQAICEPSQKTKEPQQPPSEKAKRCKYINFVRRNIKRAKKLETIRPPAHYIDTPYGDRHNLINSGLIPQFVCNRNFAKVPCYINAHKKLLQKYRKACAADQQALEGCTEFMRQHGVRKMTLDERVAILEGLKANYIEQSKIFQTLSLYTDTPPKKLRKVRLENELRQLELDIQFIHDNQVIYVSEY